MEPWKSLGSCDQRLGDPVLDQLLHLVFLTADLASDQNKLQRLKRPIRCFDDLNVGNVPCQSKEVVCLASGAYARYSELEHDPIQHRDECPVSDNPGGVLIGPAYARNCLDPASLLTDLLWPVPLHRSRKHEPSHTQPLSLPSNVTFCAGEEHEKQSLASY